MNTVKMQGSPMSNPAQRLLAKISNLSIRRKYLLAITLLFVVVASCGLYICINGSMILYNERLSEARSGFQESYATLTRFEKRMQHLVNLMQQNKDANTLLSTKPTIGSGEHRRNTLALWQLLYVLGDGSQDYTCTLYVDPALGIDDVSSPLLPLDDISLTPWGEELLSGWGWPRYHAGETLGAPAPALLAPIRKLSDYSSLIAILRIDFQPEAIARMLEGSLSTPYASCYLHTAEGASVYLSDPSIAPVPYDLLDPQTIDGFASRELNECTIQRKTIFYQQLANSGWRLVLQVDNGLLYRSALSVYTYPLIICILIALLGMFVSLPLIWDTASRIVRFHNHVQSVDQNGLGKRLTPMGFDEIGMLITAHNSLLDRIEALIQQQEQKEQELRRLELYALQAQIKPHFLYNTLEAVIWMAKRKETDKVTRTVRSLTQFYRLCLSHGAETLSICDELNIIRHYFQVQCLRYNDAFQLEVDVAPEMLAMMLPKITLQPLVENALMHGILESGLPQGTVRIVSRMSGQGIWELCIQDSGAHFTQEDWAHAMHHSSNANAMEGYGLINVERRLCLFMQVPNVLYLDLSDPECTCIVLPMLGKDEIMSGEL